MKYDNFNAVDSGFANIIGTPIGTMGGTMTIPPTGLQSNWVAISNFIDMYTLFEPNQSGIRPIQPPIFGNNSVNIMGLNNKYLYIWGQVRNLGANSTSAQIITPTTYGFNDLNAMKINFKNILRPLAMAYAQNPTNANLQNLDNQIAVLNLTLVPKGLRFMYNIGTIG